jgi:hypothetical protein
MLKQQNKRYLFELCQISRTKDKLLHVGFLLTKIFSSEKEACEFYSKYRQGAKMRNCRARKKYISEFDAETGFVTLVTEYSGQKRELNPFEMGYFTDLDYDIDSYQMTDSLNESFQEISYEKLDETKSKRNYDKKLIEIGNEPISKRRFLIDKVSHKCFWQMNDPEDFHEKRKEFMFGFESLSPNFPANETIASRKIFRETNDTVIINMLSFESCLNSREVLYLHRGNFLDMQAKKKSDAILILCCPNCFVPATQSHQLDECEKTKSARRMLQTCLPNWFEVPLIKEGKFHCFYKDLEKITAKVPSHISELEGYVLSFAETVHLAALSFINLTVESFGGKYYEQVTAPKRRPEHSERRIEETTTFDEENYFE